MAEQTLRAAVIGAGKMGSLHAKVLSRLEGAALAAVVDTDLARAKSLADKYGATAAAALDEVIDRIDAATIAAPTSAHLAIAEPLIRRGIPVLIEKPLAASAQQGRRIVELARQHNVVVAVGHSERCNPVVQAMKRLEIEPMFIEANRVSPYPFRSMDVGVVLDVMIHDIDIVLSLANSPLVKVDAVGVNVIADHEDICNARLFFQNGCVANITASRLALKTERKVRIFSRQAYLSLDFYRKEGMVVKADKNINIVEWIRQRQQEKDFDFSQVNWTQLLHIEPLQIENAEPLAVEQQAFLAAARGQGRPEVTAEEGLAALECAEQILSCVRQQRWKTTPH